LQAKQHNKYALLGLKTLERAAAKVAENARKNKLKIPIWKNGHIEYEIPGIITGQHSNRSPTARRLFNMGIVSRLFGYIFLYF